MQANSAPIYCGRASLNAALHESARGPTQKPWSPPGTAAYWGTAATKWTSAVALLALYAAAIVKRNVI
jgi:hypothetical protein